MPWVSAGNNPLGGALPGTVVSDGDIGMVQVGTIRNFVHDTQGEGEFIFLPGVAATGPGDIVEYTLNPAGPATIRHTNASATNSGRSVAIATAANVAGTYGWYQISGLAQVNAVGGTAAGSMFGSATAGSVTSVADAGDQILGARIETAVAAGKVYATLNRPHVQGQIT